MVDANLLKENQDLKRWLSKMKTKYENLKAEAKIISIENKSFVAALRLLNNEFSASNEGSNLHPTPSKGVEAIKSPDNSDTLSHQHTTIKRCGKFISNLTNFLQVEVMDLKKVAAMKNPDLTPKTVKLKQNP